MSRAFPHAAGIAAVLAASAVCATAEAGALHVGPMRIELTPDKSVATLEVRNDNPDAITVQLERVAWSEPAGEDVYTPTQSFIATPLVFQLASAGTQIVRLALRDATAKEGGAYRLYVREVPAEGTTKPAAVFVALRIGIPVFVTAANAKPKIDWRLERDAVGALTLTAHNVGDKFTRILSLEARGAGDHEALLQSADPTYVLADGHRRWVVKDSPNAGQQILLTAKTESATVSETLTIPN
jgi:fimbrial chaperone protein